MIRSRTETTRRSVPWTSASAGNRTNRGEDGASGYKSFRQAGRLDQNANVLNQIVGRIRCPSVCPLAFSRHTEKNGGWGCEA